MITNERQYKITKAQRVNFLGGNFQGYVEAGTLAGARDQFTPEMK